MTRLVEATTRFAARYQARADLVAEQHGWDCVIAVVAVDSGDGATVHVANGRIAAVSDGAESADLVVSADSATLLDVLESRRGPNEAYLFGELIVRGREADFLRLDYVTEALCPH